MGVDPQKAHATNSASEILLPILQRARRGRPVRRDRRPAPRERKASKKKANGDVYRTQWEKVHPSDHRMERIGCILCPYTSKPQKAADMKRWPKYVELYKKTFQRMIDKRKADGLPCDAWETGEDVFNWWIDQKKKEDDSGEISLFGLRLKESDT